MEEFTLPTFRELMGVEEGKLEPFSNLNLKAINPALKEVNALASFGVATQTKKTGRKYSGGDDRVVSEGH